MSVLRPSIKTITLKNLITFLLIIALLVVIVVGIGFRTVSKRIIENEALALAESIKIGLRNVEKIKPTNSRPSSGNLW